MIAVSVFSRAAAFSKYGPRSAIVRLANSSILNGGLIVQRSAEWAASSPVQDAGVLLGVAFAGNINEHNFALFEYFESRMASVVFSSCALEAFSNEVISRSYATGFRYTPTLKGGIAVSYDLETVERKLSLDEKLAQVIPSAYSVPSPKGKRPWAHFKKLKRLRDRIVHCKARDRSASKPDDDVLWRALLEPAATHVAFRTYDLIGHFYEAKRSEMPRWYANWPFAEPAC